MPILIPNAQQAALIDYRRQVFNEQQVIMANTHRIPHDVTAMRAAFAANDPRMMAGNASPLPKDAWAEWDRESVQIQRDELAVFNDLAASVGEAINIGKLIHYFRQVSDSGVVNISLDGRSKAKLDQQVYSYIGTPIPIIDSTFGYTWRQVQAAQTVGEQLDSDGRDNANRKVSEKLEDIVLNGDSKIVVDGRPLYGLRNHPKRGSRNTSNDLSTCTGAQWAADVIATLLLLNADHFYDDATLYVNKNDWLYAQRTLFNTTSGNTQTIAQHILSLAQVGSVVASSKVPADNIIAVVKRKTVVKLLNAMPINTQPLFRANPTDDYTFQTMAACALEIKYDGSANESCGVATSIPA
jgi:uncharacterized linocin/CFP29 family protein